MSNSHAEALLGGDELTSPFFDNFNWDQPLPDQIVAVRSLLSVCNTADLKRAIIERQARMTPAQANELEAISDYKPLTNKLCLARGNADHYYKVWLHRYKEASWRSDTERTGPVYVEQYHNHRFGIISHILVGGYDADERRLTDEDAAPLDAEIMSGDDWAERWTDHLQTLAPQAEAYQPGDVMSMHPDEVHRLRKIREGTMTLLIELPRVRNYSIGHDADGTCATHIFHDIGFDREQALAELAAS